MLRNRLIRGLTTCLLVQLLTACDRLSTLLEKEAATPEVATPTLTLAVSPYVENIPWIYAEEKGLQREHTADYKVNLQLVTDNYLGTLERFINKEAHAVAITNIDAIARLVRENISADVILITSYSAGHEALLVRAGAEAEADLQGKTVALLEFSSRHYLLDRYLLRKQIPFAVVTLHPLKREDNLATILDDSALYGVVAAHPYLEALMQEQKAQILFDSRQLPKEIMELIVVRRETLKEYPQFAQVLLATWFSVMEQLQGANRSATIETMAKLLNVSSEEFSQQLQELELNDTPTKALSALRDRSLKKTMRFIRYFVERHGLAGDEPFTHWVSYPGRTAEMLHFNGKPLQEFITPQKLKDY